MITSRGARYDALIRHLTITAVTFLFLSKDPASTAGGGGGNPDLTVCQVRAAADALVGSADLCPPCRRGRLARAAELIARGQARNRQSAACHRKATLARLEQLGVDVATLRCCILQ